MRTPDSERGFQRFRGKDLVNVRFRIDPDTCQVVCALDNGQILHYGQFMELFERGLRFYREWSDQAITDKNYETGRKSVGYGDPFPEETPVSSRKPGYIYILKSDAGCYKIGKTGDVPNRFNTSKLQLPHKVSLLHSFPSSDMSWAEKCLHWMHSSHRLNGEWFDLGEYDVLSLSRPLSVPKARFGCKR